MPRLVISYRREDTAPYAGRLYDRLSESFGRDSIFIDIDTIRPGEDFIATIEDALSDADVLLALIGPRWAQIEGAQGEKRLRDPMDYVRVEIATALSRGMRVIPVLVGGASMPNVSELPDDLTALSRRQAYSVTDSRFHADVDELTLFLSTLDDPPEGSGSLRVDETLGAPSAQITAPQERDASEIHYHRLVNSPWLEGSVLWSFGIMSLGLYYYFVASAVVQEIRQLLVVAAHSDTEQTMGSRTTIKGIERTLVAGAIAHGIGWLLGLCFLYAVVIKPPSYDVWIDKLLAAVAISLWAGSAWLLAWFWARSRAIEAEFIAAGVRLPTSWSQGDDAPQWQAGHLQKIFGFLIMFAFSIYLLFMLERSLVDGMNHGLELEFVYRSIVLMVAIPCTLLLAGHSLFKDMVWKLLGQSVPGMDVRNLRNINLARILTLDWFWPWLYANAAISVFAFYAVHESAIGLMIGR